MPPDAGAVRTFDAPVEQVKEVAVATLRQMGMLVQSVDERPESIVILLTRPVGYGGNWGGVGRVTVEKTQPVTVRLVYERRFGPNLAGYDSVFARNYYARMADALGVRPAATN